MASTNQSLTGKSRSVASGVLVSVLLAVSIVLAGVYTYEEQAADGTGPVHSLQSMVGMVFSPVQFLGAGVAYAEDTVEDAVTNATVDDETYTALQEENAQLKAQIAELEEYRTEAQTLQSLLDLADRYDYEGATGRVIGVSSDAWDQVITLSVGSMSGVEAGQAVMGADGLVGQVIEVSPLTCKVRLLADPQSGVSVLLQDSREVGVLSGSVEGLLYLENLDSSASVEVGDVVVTSGLGGTFFSGIAVGTVVNVVNSSGTSSRTIVVSPYAEADPLEELTVVTSTASSDDSSEDESSDE